LWGNLGQAAAEGTLGNHGNRAQTTLDASHSRRFVIPSAPVISREGAAGSTEDSLRRSAATAGDQRKLITRRPKERPSDNGAFPPSGIDDARSLII
jgi:hypothetical protein